MGSPILHRPVLLREALEFLKVRPDGTYIDATLGTGGHGEEILKVLRRGEGKLLGIERDPPALGHAPDRPPGVWAQLIAQHGRLGTIESPLARPRRPPRREPVS